MREVISVHVGQAGIQIGNACCTCPQPILFVSFADFEQGSCTLSSMA